MGHPVNRRNAWRLTALALMFAALPPATPAGRPTAQSGTVASLSATAAGTLRAGRTQFGANGYVEYHAGDLPIILSAPHGGSLEPVEIPNRRSGTTVTDTGTEDLARAVASALRSRTGGDPPLVICRLKRVKLDANREIGEGAQGNRDAQQAWHEYHGFLDAARAAAIDRHGRALVVDLHGHGHPKSRVEIGYLLGASDLDRPDTDLDDPIRARQSSIGSLAAERGLRVSALIRGPASLGALLESAGYASVPGPATPSAGADPYFEGGYITRRHGSADGVPCSAIQIETPYRGIRDTPAARARFAGALADALVEYVAPVTRIGR